MVSDEQRAAGWIEHDGGPCPVADWTAVEFKTSKMWGGTVYGDVTRMDWKYVTHYRRPEQQP